MQYIRWMRTRLAKKLPLSFKRNAHFCFLLSLHYSCYYVLAEDSEKMYILSLSAIFFISLDSIETITRGHAEFCQLTIKNKLVKFEPKNNTSFKKMRLKILSVNWSLNVLTSYHKDWRPWASCHIRKIAGCACVGNAGNVSPSSRVSDPDLHHDRCVTHVSWCTPGSPTSGFLWSW